MIKSIKELLKLDRTAIFVILFWSVIYSVIIVMLYMFAIPLDLKYAIFSFFMLYFVYNLLVTSLQNGSLKVAILKQVIYFLIGPILTFVAVIGSLVVVKEILVTNQYLLVTVFILGFSIPHLTIVIMLLMKDYKNMLMSNLKRIKLSINFSLAVVTVLFLLIPILVIEEKKVLLVQIFFLIPFIINLFSVLLIDMYYLRISEKLTSENQ